MAKLIISLLLVASLAGIVAGAASTSGPGDMLYPFKTHVNDPIAALLCQWHLSCPQPQK